MLERNHSRDSRHGVFCEGRRRFRQARNETISNRSHPKAKFTTADTVRTSDGASINLALIPGAFVQLSGNSEIKIEDLSLTKDGNETAGGMLDRRARIRLNRGRLDSVQPT